MTQLALPLSAIECRVHCPFCKHVVTNWDPVVAHARMESHFAGKHERLIDQIVGYLRPLPDGTRPASSAATRASSSSTT